MSIYATLWHLKFPHQGDDHIGCDWIDILAQGVPAHIGTPTPGFGYEEGDPYASFLPPAIEVSKEDDHQKLRAVVIVVAGSPKGTERSGQEYVNPLLVLSGDEYAAMSFEALHERICDALRGGRPRILVEALNPAGTVKRFFEEGSSKLLEPEAEAPQRG